MTDKSNYGKARTLYRGWSIDQWAIACGEFSGYASEVQKRWAEKYSFEPGEGSIMTTWVKNWDAAGEIWQRALQESEGWS